jgi:hypothetical protein
MWKSGSLLIFLDCCPTMQTLHAAAKPIMQSEVPRADYVL